MQKIVIFTGAGISSESGLGTFRDNGGLWEQYKIEDVATFEAFKKNPELVKAKKIINEELPKLFPNEERGDGFLILQTIKTILIPSYMDLELFVVLLLAMVFVFSLN